jgi:hypothetical protein
MTFYFNFFKFDGLGPAGFHPWRRYDNVLAWTVLRTGIS